MPGNFFDGIPSQADLQATLRLPPFFVCEMRYIKSDGTLGFVWGEDAVLFRNPPEMPPTSQEDVATSYTFRWSKPSTPDGTSSGGFIVRQYFLQDRGPQGGTKIVCVNYDAEKMTSKYIGNLLVNAYQSSDQRGGTLPPRVWEEQSYHVKSKSEPKSIRSTTAGGDG